MIAHQLTELVDTGGQMDVIHTNFLKDHEKLVCFLSRFTEILPVLPSK